MECIKIYIGYTLWFANFFICYFLEVYLYSSVTCYTYFFYFYLYLFYDCCKYLLQCYNCIPIHFYITNPISKFLRWISLINLEVTCYIQKALALFQTNILPHSNMVVNSTEKFINMINNVNMNKDTIMVSLNIVSLFTSIDTQEVIQGIRAVIDRPSW